MFGQLIDIILINNNSNYVEYIEEFPFNLLNNFNQTTGYLINGSFIVINYQYGADFSGPGKDVFKKDRAVGSINMAHESNFIHPVLYYFNEFPRLVKQRTIKEQLIEQATKHHHMIEDFLTFWNDPVRHEIQLRRFYESVFKINLKKYSLNDCVNIHAKYFNMPLSCNKYFE
jgi:hypothetical protein